MANTASSLDGIVCRIRRLKLSPPMKPGAGTEHLEDAHPGGPDECLVLDDLRKATEVLALTLGEFMTPAG
jgi:hypothetical protein